MAPPNSSRPILLHRTGVSARPPPTETTKRLCELLDPKKPKAKRRKLCKPPNPRPVARLSSHAAAVAAAAAAVPRVPDQASVAVPDAMTVTDSFLSSSVMRIRSLKEAPTFRPATIAQRKQRSSRTPFSINKSSKSLDGGDKLVVSVENINKQQQTITSAAAASVSASTSKMMTSSTTTTRATLDKNLYRDGPRKTSLLPAARKPSSRATSLNLMSSKLSSSSTRQTQQRYTGTVMAMRPQTSASTTITSTSCNTMLNSHEHAPQQTHSQNTTLPSNQQAAQAPPPPGGLRDKPSPSSNTCFIPLMQFQPPPPVTFHQPCAAWQDIPRPEQQQQQQETKKKTARKNHGNFVRLNMRNSAGACRGARNKKTKSKASARQQQYQLQRQQQQSNDDDDDETTSKMAVPVSRLFAKNSSSSMIPTSRNGIDPIDDYLDGVFMNTKSKKRNNANAIPLCAGHQRPCKLLTVKKNTSGNKGRQFYCCSFPRGEQCDHFAWADDTIEATRAALLKNTSHSGFVARQVTSYVEQIKCLTVPELKRLAQQHGMAVTGKKQQLLTRMAIWVRDEITTAFPNQPNDNEDNTPVDDNQGGNNSSTCAQAKNNGSLSELVNSDDDDESTSEEELELFGGDNDDSDDDDDDDDVSSIANETNQGPASSSLIALKLRSTRKRGSIAVDEDDEAVRDTNGTNAARENAPLSSPTLRSTRNRSAMGEDDVSQEGEEDEMKSANKESGPHSLGEEMTCPLRSTLRSVFGHDDFREGQEWLIKRCLNQERSLLVAPTGFGKSLCYALPAALMDGVCIVVSPLLSLIQDQIRVLPPRLPAATLSGQMSTAAMAATVDDIIRGRIKILFVSPERLASSSFRRMFRPKWNQETNQYTRQFPTVSLLCVDEAHCLSQWAHNFRPSYLRIRSMMQMMQPQGVVAITATAGPRVVDDICNALDIRRSQEDSSMECGVRVLATNRDNIDVKCFVLLTQQQRLSKLLKILLPKPKVSETQDSDADEDGYLSNGSVIVYVWRQRDAEAVAENINAAGVSGGVVIYHGGMPAAARTRAQSRFMRGKARICVATVAFGLGINKADVAGVIHMYLSASPEHYLQEIGRAGRDGRSATAIALVLKDEVLIRNSLAYSDLLAKSQISGVLSILRKRTQDALAMLTEPRPDSEPINLGLSFYESSLACDCKPETIETIVSLLEQRNGAPLVCIEGSSYDSVTIALKRRNLSDLSQREPIAKAIQRCATCLEPPAGESYAIPSDMPRTQALEHKNIAGFSYGSYAFSVSDCSNCLGATAEPRHVFAALRRLECSGEIALALDTSPKGRSLHLRLTSSGMFLFRQEYEESLASLATEVFSRLSGTILANSNKCLDLNHVLHEVSLSTKNTETNLSESEISPSLQRFQELITRYFESEGKGESLSDEGRLSSMFSAIPSNTSYLLRDARSALYYLLEVERAVEGTKLVRLRDTESLDYTVLTVTKFLHGIALPTVSMQLLRQNPLFGSHQGIQFGNLRNIITKLFEENC